jgi:hypothetical protein
MKNFVSLMAAGGFALFCAGSALADTSPSAPMRHLVYSFSYGATSSMTVHNSGFANDGNGGGSGSGVETARGHEGANGKLVVDVLREQPDKGLVVTVAESSDNNERSTKPATCVVYGTGSMICDPNATVNTEALALLRLLGSNFVDPALVDAKQHWHLASDGVGYSAVSDYTIASNKDGVMSIKEDRQLTYTGSRRGTAQATATIGYDFNRSLPTSLSELTTGREQRGNDYTDVKTSIDATLVSDSMAAAGATPH